MRPKRHYRGQGERSVFDGAVFRGARFRGDAFRGATIVLYFMMRSSLMRFSRTLRFSRTSTQRHADMAERDQPLREALTQI
jgi:hypothetical protein